MKNRNIEKKSFSSPDATNNPGEKLTVEIINANGLKISKITASPGWRWSEHLKPIVKTKTCEMHHLVYVLSGILAARLDDGKEEQFGPGEIGNIPPGHDGWTVGDEPAVWLEISH